MLGLVTCNIRKGYPESVRIHWIKKYMYYLQRVYSLTLNNLLFTRYANKKVRKAVMFICSFFLTSFYVAYFDINNTFRLINQNTKCNIICGAVLVILVIFSVDRPLKCVTWNKPLFWLFFSAGAGLFIISLIHPVGSGYRTMGLMMMVGFPCLYFVWNNRGDYEVLFNSLSTASMLTGVIVYLQFVYMATHGELINLGGRVSAFFINSNMFSMFGVMMVCSATYMFLAKRESMIWFVANAFIYAMGWDIILLSVSRAALLIGLGSVFSLAIFELKYKGEEFSSGKRRTKALRIAAVFSMVFVFFFIGDKLVDINSIIIYRQQVEAEQAKQEEAVAEGEIEVVTAADSDESSDIEVPEEITENDTDSFANRLDTNNGSDFSAGRIMLWKQYVSHLNLLGNSFNKKDVLEMTGGYVTHAHNNFLEFGYRCGVPVALLHIALELYAGIICLIFLFNKKYNKPEHLFAIVFMVCYAVYSMLDVATLPFERPAPFFFYMLLTIVFGETAQGIIENDECE